MKKFRSLWLVASFLGWLLAWEAPPAGAYYPPLQATATSTSSSVTFNVTLPQGGGVEATAMYPPGVTVSSLTQQNGVIAWITGNGSTFNINCCTYDPFLETFKQTSLEPYTQVSQLKVADGVVAYLAVLASGNHDIGYTTYDPAQAAWVSGHTEWANISSFQHFLVKEGVVAWVAEQGGGTLVQYTIRDPRSSSWNVDGTWYATLGGVDYFAITNTTVYWDRASINWFAGYRSEEVPVGGYYGGWMAFELTKLLAYFVAQPVAGVNPLWVWFTDMSIGATGWSWQFADGGTSTSRSPYHSFTKTGIFPVTQQVTGNGSDTYTRKITVGTGMSPILYLLLGD